eukprot:m.128300 g.128300  ORF g.128300 m.128300 type:complete len:61 (-) comp13024_c0_seq1:3378-3560(-)
MHMHRVCVCLLCSICLCFVFVVANLLIGVLLLVFLSLSYCWNLFEEVAFYSPFDPIFFLL